MFNKIKQQLANINNPKNKKKSPMDDFSDKNLDIDLANLWKYSSQELHAFIGLYEKQCEKFRKHYSDIHDENAQLKERMLFLETEKSQALTEKQQFKLQVDNICMILSAETKEKEKLRSEFEAFKNQKASQATESNGHELEGFKGKLEGIEAILREKQEENPNLFETVSKEIESLKLALTESAQKLREDHQVTSSQSRFSTEYKEKYEQTLLNLEKCEKIKGELESDLLKMSEKLSVLKVENLNLTNSLNELKARVKSEEIKISDLSLENRNLSEENDLIKGKISSVLNEKTKMEEMSSNGARESKLRLDEANQNIARLEESIKQQTENFIVKQRDLENKLIQERLKSDQKSRDFSKLEEQYNQAKADLVSQIETTNKAHEKIQVLELKILNDKKRFKEEKHKFKALKQEIIEIHNKHNGESEVKDARIREMETNFAEIQNKLSSLEEERQKFLSQDLELKSKEMQLQELATSEANLKREIEELAAKVQGLESENASQKQTIQALQEKREASLQEIHRLSHEVQGLKASLQAANTGKAGNSIGGNQGFSGAMGDSQKVLMGGSSLKKEESKVENNWSGKKEEQLRKEEVPTPSIKSAMIRKQAEAKYLGMTKKELEALYREMLQVLLPLMNDSDLTKAFVKVEKKLNDAIRRAQDHIDNLQEIKD